MGRMGTTEARPYLARKSDWAIKQAAQCRVEARILRDSPSRGDSQAQATKHARLESLAKEASKFDRIALALRRQGK
jgi:hypothetical protein